MNLILKDAAKLPGVPVGWRTNVQYVGSSWEQDDAYKNYTVAEITHERTVRASGSGPGSAEQSWRVRDTSGNTLSVRLTYDLIMPARAKAESKVYSAVEPTFFRIYRVEQGVDVVKSVVTRTDRVRGYEFQSTVSAFSKLFDGGEKLISITSIPWYVRQVYLP